LNGQQPLKTKNSNEGIVHSAAHKRHSRDDESLALNSGYYCSISPFVRLPAHYDVHRDASQHTQTHELGGRAYEAID
jgi:hypothetical protein